MPASINLGRKKKILTKNSKEFLAKSKLDELKSMLVDYSLTSTAQGCQKIFQAKSIKAKLIWVIVFLGSFGGTAFFESKGLIDYLQYEVVSKTRVFKEIPSVFPAVTICDNNAFTSKSAQDLIKNISMRTYGQNIFDMSYDEVENKSGDIIELAK